MYAPGPGFRFAAAALALVPGLAPQVAHAEGFHFRDEAVLGTRLHLIVNAASEFAAQRAALAVRSEIDRLDRILNSRKVGSELVRLNQALVFEASADLFAVVQAAECWRELSGGGYSGRLGRVIDEWRKDRLPSRGLVARLAAAADEAEVRFEGRVIHRPQAVLFALDGLAKGYIIDRALEAGLTASAAVRGLILDIGGDVRALGMAPGTDGWRVGVPDPFSPADNAPLVEVVTLKPGQALAGSGRGPRDRLIDGRRYSPTLSPATGWPVETIAAHVVADSAADADALASACMVAPQREAAYRITGADGGVEMGGVWRTLSTAAPVLTPVQNRGGWPSGWQALATFTAPRRQLIRDPDFRSPYMALWITDLNNKPVRTLLLVGKFAVWQKDNFIWWNSNPGQTTRLVAVRAMGTSGLGIYNVFWDGVDDQNRVVPAGKYMLHVETSRERGKHTYRSMTIDFTKASRFKASLAPTEEGGGIDVTYDHY